MRVHRFRSLKTFLRLSRVVHFSPRDVKAAGAAPVIGHLLVNSFNFTCLSGRGHTRRECADAFRAADHRLFMRQFSFRFALQVIADNLQSAAWEQPPPSPPRPRWRHNNRPGNEKYQGAHYALLYTDSWRTALL